MRASLKISAKLLMMVEALVALVTVLAIASRAVGLLGS